MHLLLTIVVDDLSWSSRTSLAWILQTSWSTLELKRCLYTSSWLTKTLLSIFQTIKIHWFHFLATLYNFLIHQSRRWAYYLDGAAKLRNRFHVRRYARPDVPRYSDELKLVALIVDGVDAGLRRNRLSLRYGKLLRLPQRLDGGGD